MPTAAIVESHEGIIVVTVSSKVQETSDRSRAARRKRFEAPSQMIALSHDSQVHTFARRFHVGMTEWSKVWDSSESFLVVTGFSHQRKLAGVQIPFPTNVFSFVLASDFPLTVEF